MVNIVNVKKTYRLGKTTVQALKGVDLSVAKGEMICIMGPSGSGKSTLLNMIGCLDMPDSGEVYIDGRNVVGLSRTKLAELRAGKIGFIFQSFNLVPVLNVYENVELPLYLQIRGVKDRSVKARIDAILDEVGLSEFRRHKPDELSGGQRQRVAIARALVTQPEIVLADEPTANLDSSTALTILKLMKRLNEEEKATFIFSTHDPAITSFADRTCRLKDGQLEKEKEWLQPDSSNLHYGI